MSRTGCALAVLGFVCGWPAFGQRSVESLDRDWQIYPMPDFQLWPAQASLSDAQIRQLRIPQPGRGWEPVQLPDDYVVRGKFAAGAEGIATTVLWTPAPSGNVWMGVVSAADSNFTYGFTTNCVAPASAGTFTIPAYALLPHIPGNVSYLQLFSAQSFAFTAPGANAAMVNAQLWGPSPGLTLK